MAPECRQLEETFLHAWVDGEFSAEESAEVQLHLDQCPACAGAAARHRSYKAAVQRAGLKAPHAFDHLLRERLAEEAVEGRWGRAFKSPRGIAVAAAAVGAAAWFLAGGLSHPLFTRGHSLIDDGVALHARALPLDFVGADATSAQQWLSNRLDFSARVPQFARGPRLEGVRLSSLHSHPAAVVTYTIPANDGRRVSLLIVDDPEQQLPGAARQVANREVWLSQARGFNIASWRNDEVVYSLISDLDEQDVLALVQAAEMR
ncbi:MAG TPA: zf-HC2 domain-containing protein [Myxococcales bacterium]|nr:zf-HC2 domain-containing protein [Myxococcales bacterium]